MVFNFYGLHHTSSTFYSYDSILVVVGNGALDIRDDLYVIAYLQASEILIKLTPKEWDWIVHKAKQFKWKNDSLLWVWTNWWVWVIPHLEQCEGLVDMFTRSWANLGSNKSTICSRHNTSGEGCNCKFNIFFWVYGVWPSLGIFECTYTSFITLTNYGAWIPMEFGFCKPIEFDTLT